MSRKNNVMFSKPEEPSFLRKMKEKFGYQEGPTVDTKKEELPQAEEEDFEDRRDEKPTIVFLEKGNVSREEAENFIKDLEKEEEDGEEKKPVFKKPRKRESEPSTSAVFHSSKKQNTSEESRRSSQSKRIRNYEDEKLQVKGVKNSKLLSFDDDEEDES